MHFDLKDTELEIIERTAIEEDISLDNAIKKLLHLGREALRLKEEEEPQQEFISLDQVKGTLDMIEDRLNTIQSHTLCMYINTQKE